MSKQFLAAVRVLARVCLRLIDQLRESEREEVLNAISEIFASEEGETAARMLHAIREARRLQLELRGILNEPRE